MIQIFEAPTSLPGTSTLIATVATWKAVLALRSIPRGGSVSHVRQEGEAFSQAEWGDITTRIKQAVDGKEDDAVVRIWFARAIAARLIDASRV